jgi:hypothetical protein
VAAGAGMYYAVPQAWLKVAWGLAAGAIAYLALEALQRVLRSRRGQPATAQKPAPPSPSEGY